MNWTSILLSALVAGLAAALTQYLRRKGKIGGITSAVIIAVAILVWNVGYRQYIAPGCKIAVNRKWTWRSVR
jgi:uncharacterized membrane protein (UPF0136 family)